jgi:tocopherol O-methyltransferase
MIVPRAGIADVAAVAAHYDELDDLYRGLWGTNLHHGYWITGRESTEEAVANLTRLVAREAALKPGERVCDLGSGYGAAALLWHRDYRVQVTGITISEKQYRYAKSAADGNLQVTFVRRDAARRALPSASFDVVTAIESSEHMASKDRFFCEAHRLLRPAGRCVVAAWLTRDHPARHESKYLLDPICTEGRLPSMASAAEYRSMLADAGFHDIQFSDLTRRVKKPGASARCASCADFLTIQHSAAHSATLVLPTGFSPKPFFASGSPIKQAPCASAFSPRKND